MITAMCDVMKECYERGWLTTRDGNASLRRSKSDIVYITPTGVRKNVIRVEDLIKMRVKDQELILPEGARPSGELHMHRLLQLVDNSKTRVVLHAHPTHIIAALYAGWTLQQISTQFPELSRYTKVGPDVPVLPVTSEILGNETFKALTDGNDRIIYDIVAQDRHGVCVVGSDPWTCFEHIERADHVCQIILKSGVAPK
jgi:ribulose-5-phosphate 4-epimerase/fuculose-1-phosphate aldolase